MPLSRPPAPAGTQDEHRARLAEDCAAVTRRTRAVREAVPPERLDWRPSDTAWSVGQVFEHLCLAHQSYLDPMERLIAAARPAPDRARAARWRPTVMGNLLVRSFRSPRRLPAPRIYRPGPTPRPGVIGAFLECQAALASLLERAADLAWTAIRMRSPVTPLIRVNLGDGFAILVTHAERHLDQVDRIVAAMGLPPGPAGGDTRL